MQHDLRAGRPPSAQRSSSVHRSNSAQRRAPNSVRSDAHPGIHRPPSSRIADSPSRMSPRSDGGQLPRVSSSRPSPESVYSASNVRDATRRSGHAPKAPLSAAGVLSARTRSTSNGPATSRASSNTAHGGNADVTRTSVFAYLKVYGLNQYARAFLEGGLVDLETIGRLTETEALEFLERLRVYPGHRLRLLRAVDCLRHAALGAERRDPAQMLEDDAALERLCAQKDELTKEKSEVEHASKRLQEEHKRLLNAISEQGSHLQKARERIAELEELVQSQTEQVAFLTQQLQLVAVAGGPERVDELFRSYKGSFEDASNDADWEGAKELVLPEDTVLPAKMTMDRLEDDDLSKPRAFASSDFGRPTAPNSAPAPTARNPASDQLGRHEQKMLSTFSPPRRAKMAQSLDSAKIKECLAGFDVDHVIRCLATALQNKIILAVSKSRPHTASAECLAACLIFVEPACKHKLESQAAQIREHAAFGNTGAAMKLKDSMGKPANPLNAIAIREVPNKWDIYGFLRDVMVNFRLEPEVSVVTLVYLERFTGMSGVEMTPDNWQRLAITAMMLASKVWNDETFENAEFAQLCPLYTVDEINTFERIFLKCVGYNMSAKGSEYAKTYFLLRTLGAKDSAEFTMEPIDNMRASRLQQRCLEKQIEFRERYPDDVANVMNWTL